MMKKLSVGLIVLFLLPLALAAQTRVDGDMNLNWDNAPTIPQLFSGELTGGLAGQITMTTQGNVWSSDVVLTLIDTTCEGFYGGSNVVGTFTLSCLNGNIIQGVMHGGVDELTQYNAVIISPTPGPKGDNGEQGIQGEKGEKGDKGDQGVPGINGTNGKDGINGTNGLDGRNGIDSNNETVIAIQAILDASRLYSTFKPFWAWYDAGICETGTKMCSGDKSLSCVKNKWNTGTKCKWGCVAGACAPQPTEDCTEKENNFSRCKSYTGKTYGYAIFTDYYTCNTGQGTPTACNVGQCKGSDVYRYCSKGCDAEAMNCKV